MHGRLHAGGTDRRRRGGRLARWLGRDGANHELDALVEEVLSRLDLKTLAPEAGAFAVVLEAVPADLAEYAHVDDAQQRGAIVAGGRRLSYRLP